MDYQTLCYGCFSDKESQDPCSCCGWAEDTGPESALHLPPGTVLEGKYIIGRALGQGGFGITYLAYDQKLNLKLAIKEYLPQELVYRIPGHTEVSIYKKTLVQHFSYGLNKYLEEARTLARFAGHPGIVTVRDFFEANGTAYIVMEYIEGVTLKEYLEKKDKPLPFQQALNIFMPVLDALKEIHGAGILHRDISPDNLLIDARGRVVLIDFGAARQAMGDKSKSMSVVVKDGYSPIEQYQGKSKQGPWTDIYAVTATMYRTITGQTPLEAIDRMVEDNLVPPSQLGVLIEPCLEKVLFKGISVKAKERYQVVEDFQADLLTAGQSLKDKKSDVVCEELIKPENIGGERPANLKTLKAKEKDSAVQQESGAATGDYYFKVGKKVICYAVGFIFSILFYYGGISLLGSGADTETMSHPEIASTDAEYYIDYENGGIPIGDLPIGARVVDLTWEWEFRTGLGYAREEKDETKPVTWIVVDRDHYEGLEPHVTILSDELIGRYAFDNSSDRGHVWGSNHWGESGTTDATHGLRPWLNSNGIHSGEGFYQAFSERFKSTVLNTTVTNKEWESGIAYGIQDKVFIPSTTELGDTEHLITYIIGTSYPYFFGESDAKRSALLGGEDWWYWTRSPSSNSGAMVRDVAPVGNFYNGTANSDYNGVRPALNLKAGTMVTEIRN